MKLTDNQLDKIKRDDLYYRLYLEGGFDAIEKAGFFFDKQNAPLDFKKEAQIPCTPINDLIKNLRNNPHKPCVLLSTGCFAPFHQGHLDMMKTAITTAEMKGYDVIASYFSPDHNDYIDEKVGRKKYYMLQAEQRIAYMYNEFIKYHNEKYPYEQINIDPWAAIFAKTSLNFTDVKRRLEEYIKVNTGREIPVFMVFGEDNIRFADLFKKEKDAKCIVVSREVDVKQKPEHLYNKNLIYVSNHFPLSYGISSSKIRENYIELTSNKWFKDRNKTALVRFSDFENSLQNQLYFKVILKHLKFVKINHFKYSDEHINKKHVVNMDPSVSFKNNLEISRNYDRFGVQYIKHVPRPECGKSFIEQISNFDLDVNTVILSDDDSFSGKTMDVAEQILKENGISVLKRETLLKNHTFDEILDIKDFIYKDKSGGGLVINGKRCPYIYPFVSPYTRASVINTKQFSIDVWLENINYYQKIGNSEIVEECKFYLNMII